MTKRPESSGEAHIENLSSETGEKILRAFLKIVGRHPEILKRNENRITYHDGSKLDVTFSVGTELLPVLNFRPQPATDIPELPEGIALGLPVDQPARVHNIGDFPRLATSEEIRGLYDFISNHSLEDIAHVRPAPSNVERRKAEYALEKKIKKRD